MGSSVTANKRIKLIEQVDGFGLPIAVSYQ